MPVFTSSLLATELFIGTPDQSCRVLDPSRAMAPVAMQISGDLEMAQNLSLFTLIYHPGLQEYCGGLNLGVWPWLVPNFGLAQQLLR